jgi:hypothetical protein
MALEAASARWAGSGGARVLGSLAPQVRIVRAHPQDGTTVALTFNCWNRHI